MLTFRHKEVVLLGAGACIHKVCCAATTVQRLLGDRADLKVETGTNKCLYEEIQPDQREDGLYNFPKFNQGICSKAEVYLNDRDTSIRRRALDLLYLMCNFNNVGKIVEELLNYMETTDMSIKEELVLKIAILAEQFAPNLTWYLDVMIRLMSNSGDYVTDEIWYRVIQIITGFGSETNQNLQRYAATLLFNSLSMPHIHEILIKLVGVLSEFGGLIVDLIGTPEKLFNVIHKHFDQCSSQGKAMLFNSYAKLAKRVGPLRDFVLPVLEAHLDHWNPDLQQRALEYYTLLSNPNKDFSEVRDIAFQRMPTYPLTIQEQNPLLTKKGLFKSKDKEGDDPTLEIQAKKMLEHQMDIIKARSEQISSTNPTKGVVYEDMFLEPDVSHIKFEGNPLFEVVNPEPLELPI